MPPQAPPQLDWIADSMAAVNGSLFRQLVPQHVGATIRDNPFDSQPAGNPNLPYTDQHNKFLVSATLSDTMWQQITGTRK